ncbi:MAG: hypothetical protein V4534_08850 [Myxococcota bacterium]
MRYLIMLKYLFLTLIVSFSMTFAQSGGSRNPYAAQPVPWRSKTQKANSSSSIEGDSAAQARQEKGHWILNVALSMYSGEQQFEAENCENESQVIVPWTVKLEKDELNGLGLGKVVRCTFVLARPNLPIARPASDEDIEEYEVKKNRAKYFFNHAKIEDFIRTCIDSDGNLNERLYELHFRTPNHKLLDKIRSIGGGRPNRKEFRLAYGQLKRLKLWEVDVLLGLNNHNHLTICYVSTHAEELFYVQVARLLRINLLTGVHIKTVPESTSTFGSTPQVR